MRHAVWLMLLPASAVVVFAHFADWPSDGAGALAAPPLSLDGYLDEKLPEAPKRDAEPKQKAGPPPLVVDRGAPLLLDAMPDKAPSEPADRPVADNSACYVCHTNYQEEDMVVVHARENIGCMKCHGKSYAHRDDEDNITPPDIMYAQDVVDTACKECHQEHDVAATKIITRWQERCPGKEDPGQIICTDCHGAHRLAVRTVRWDKKTRQLLARTEEPVSVATGDTEKPSDGQ